MVFPYFFVGTFIEAQFRTGEIHVRAKFPYFFVGTFIEASMWGVDGDDPKNFPTFS